MQIALVRMEPDNRDACSTIFGGDHSAQTHIRIIEPDSFARGLRRAGIVV
jgi:hypothetical protein